MRTNFTKALAHVLQSEGGFSKHEKDPGGATMKGISLTTYRSYYGPNVTVSDLKGVPQARVEYIYRRGYWDVCGCDNLPLGIDYAVFDTAVHSGSRLSILLLQRAAGVTDDGILGPVTLHTVNNFSDKINLIEKMFHLRLEFLMKLPNWKTFGTGWGRRVRSVRAASRSMLLADTYTPRDELKMTDLDKFKELFDSVGLEYQCDIDATGGIEIDIHPGVAYITHAFDADGKYVTTYSDY